MCPVVVSLQQLHKFQDHNGVIDVIDIIYQCHYQQTDLKKRDGEKARDFFSSTEVLSSTFKNFPILLETLDILPVCLTCQIGWFNRDRLL